MSIKPSAEVYPIAALSPADVSPPGSKVLAVATPVTARVEPSNVRLASPTACDDPFAVKTRLLTSPEATLRPVD